MLHTGENFGSRVVELSGIIVDPEYQEREQGLKIVRTFIAEQRPELMTAYTRNPAILRILSKVGEVDDVLHHTITDHSPEEVPHASIHNGVMYHLDRYGPHGLYGTFDPADRQYKGVILKNRCELLENPNHALAVAVTIPGESND